MVSDGDDGWRPWQTVPRVVGGVVATPIVLGFVALGASVLVVRSLRELTRGTWRFSTRRGSEQPPDRGDTDSDAA